MLSHKKDTPWLGYKGTEASIISKELEEPKARDIMYKNFYGWFDRVSTGLYKLSSKGKDEIGIWLNKVG